MTLIYNSKKNTRSLSLIHQVSTAASKAATSDNIPTIMPNFNGRWPIKDFNGRPSRALDIAQGRQIQVDYEFTTVPPSSLYTSPVVVEFGMDISGYLAKDVEVGAN